MQRLDAREFLLEIFAMSLDRSAERPEIHAVGTDADGPAPAAGAEGKDLVEAIEQPRPLLLLDEPMELRPVGSELGGTEPLGEVFQRLILDGGVGLDALDALGGGG